jgi:hypothetical protein
VVLALWATSNESVAAEEFGGRKSEQVKRLKDLELENSRLRKAVPR